MDVSKRHLKKNPHDYLVITYTIVKAI